MAEEEDIKVTYEIRPDIDIDFGRRVLSIETFRSVYAKQMVITGVVSAQGSKLDFRPGHPMLMPAKDIVTLVQATGRMKALNPAVPKEVELARDCAITFGLYPADMTITEWEHRLWKLNSFHRKRLATFCGLPVEEELKRRMEGKRLTIQDFVKALLEVAGVDNSLPETEASRRCEALVTKGRDWPFTFLFIG